MFSPDTYAMRRTRLIESMKSGIILFPSNPDSPMNYRANVYPYRQDSNFLYFFGIDRPGYSAILDIESNETTLYGNDPSMDDIIWTGPQPSLRSLASACGVKRIKDGDELPKALAAALKSGRKIHFLPIYRSDLSLTVAKWLNKHPQELSPSQELIKGVVALRSIKSEEELEELEDAVNLTGQMHLAAMKAAAPGMMESEVHSKMMCPLYASESMVSFPAIVSVRGEVLHNHHHHNILEDGQLLLVDCGAESAMHYAGDMTRTFPVNGKFDKWQREIYQVVLDAQEHAIDCLAPGILYRDVHYEASLKIAEGLNQLGLMKGDPADAVHEGAHALFFPMAWAI